MGLASKMAAANANTGGAAPAPLPAPGAPPTSTYPGQQSQSQYGAPPGQPPQHQHGQQPHFSSYPGQQQQQYGAPPGAPPKPVGAPGGYAPPSGAPPSSGYAPPSGAPPSQYGQPPQGGYKPPQGAPPQQSQYGAPPGQQQQQYGAPPQQQHYGAPPQQQQYGAPPQQQQHQYGAPPAGGAGGPTDSRYILGIFQQCVQDQHIQSFYPPGSLEPIAQRVAQSGALDRVCRDWKIQKEFGSDLVKLALFDIVLYVDDSGSMAFEQGGERIDDLKLIMNRVSYAASLFDQDGIQVRFMNSRVNGDNIANEQQAEQLLQQVRFSGLTPLGTSMDGKILQPLVLGPARAGRLQKPVLIITITDGAPAGEDRYKITQVISNCVRELGRTRYGADAVSFQFAQVGDDEKALNFLAELDNHPEVGGLVDVTSNYELESAEMMRKSGQELTPSLWLVKMLLGGIDSSYDEKDEA